VRCDFHLHTHLSDGDLTPVHLRSVVQRHEVQYFSVTDHDTMSGFSALRGTPGLVPGVEITAGLAGREIHLVALGIDPDDTVFAAFLSAIRATRLQRLRILIERLPHQVSRGLTLELLQQEKEFAQAHCFGRLHLAKALVKRGGVASIHAAFADYLGDESREHGGVVNEAELPPYPHPSSVCAAITAAKGVSILAHPGIYGTCAQVAAMLDLGCDGLEIDHPNLDPGLKAQLATLASERRLLISSGSDLHFLGGRKPGAWSLTAEQWRPLCERLGLSA
jgi:predicted metal-dependent phosphoesterase TrpH